ncbi:alpha-amylase [Sporothrix schenckii 1099-18]|uniref:Alpha-amylase n=1 Tax=Sporothrix schenckii 1099-18 TaxID=1397361 RepID=A0A0F2LZ09_SPOSC|nr:alpha-amylase [Sporothrix schenckii 1099-18]KJR82064.1 alpha-amylase [Sporothrix schenckii 1099-18]
MSTNAVSDLQLVQAAETAVGSVPATRHWWKEACIYQIYPASFFDSNGDGIGDIAGIESKLDYLQTLGVDVVWLCPVYTSPQVDMGYDIADYRTIHKPYGTLDDVDRLIAALHQRQMKLVMDLVVNHTSDQHEWFQQSRSSRDSPMRDWYIWRKPVFAPDGTRHPPNNWASIFGGSAWEYDEATREYYLHLFCTEQPDLNWENPAVVAAVHDIMTFWLDRGVDGFRMDVINLISKVPGLPDAPITLPGAAFQPAHDHYANGPRLHEFLRGLRAILDRYNAFAIGEMPWAKTTDEVVMSVAEDRRELNMVFQFDIVDMDMGVGGKFSPRTWTLQTLKDIVQKWQTCMQAQGGWNTLFLENHDQSRSVSRFTPHRPAHRSRAAKMLATFIGLQSGTLFIYQGQELGMQNLPKEWPIEEYLDVETQNFYKEFVSKHGGDKAGVQQLLGQVALKARDHARSPVQWTDEANAGFTTGTPWMRVNDDYGECNAQGQLKDADSVFAFWRRLLQLRRHRPDVFVYGRFEMVDMGHPTVVCYRRISATSGATATVVANFTDNDQRWAMPPELWSLPGRARVILTNVGAGSPLEVDVQPDHTVLLKPFEAFVLLEESSAVPSRVPKGHL